MTEKRNLYFIAIVPPANVCDEITSIKEDFAKRFESRRALKVIPHITLKAPFAFPAANHELVIEWFDKMPVTVAPFHQELKDFGAFHNKKNPVIYVQPLMTPALHSLQRQVLVNFVSAHPGEGIMKLELEFSPHITVAYRDLQPRLFKEAWKQYEAEKYNATFDVSNFHLLQHDGRMWNIISTFYLK